MGGLFSSPSAVAAADGEPADKAEGAFGLAQTTDEGLGTSRALRARACPPGAPMTERLAPPVHARPSV